MYNNNIIRMNSKDYLNIEIKNLLSEKRPNVNFSQHLNPYEGHGTMLGGCKNCPMCGGCNGCPMCGSGINGGNKYTDFMKIRNTLGIDAEQPYSTKISRGIKEHDKLLKENKLDEYLKEHENIIKKIEAQVPSQIVPELTLLQLENAKNTIKKTYLECLNSQPAGKKRKMCHHLTIKYIENKLQQIEDQKGALEYNSFADCMVGEKKKGFKKGIMKRCHPFIKKTKYVPTEAQKQKNKDREKRVKKKAKELKITHPNMYYIDRVKKARKLVK